MVIFLIGSALAGTSQNMTQLIIYRGIQGLGAGALMPIAMAIIGDVFPPAERGKWQGLIVAVFGLSSIVGPTAGGWITDNWGWRWVFYVNMPAGAITDIFAVTTGVMLLALITTLFLREIPLRTSNAPSAPADGLPGPRDKRSPLRLL